MTQLAAISALQTLEGLAEAQTSRSARPTRTQADVADPTARGPAVINEVEDIRSKFSREEITSVAMALGSMSGPYTPEDRVRSVDSLLASIAARRDRGETVFLIVVSAKEGGGIAMLRSASELQADLDSDDPASMGSFTGQDGKTRYIRNMVREVVGLDEALSADPKATVANGVVKELRSYNPRPELDEAKNLELKGEESKSALLFKKPGDSVSIQVFAATPANPSASAGYGPPGAQA